jgi:hypothetical protein
VLHSDGRLQYVVRVDTARSSGSERSLMDAVKDAFTGS